MVFKLGLFDQKNWRRLRGSDYLSQEVTGTSLKDRVGQSEINQVAA
jgi:hypothetical protein